ncbi:MAG: hypothetical protein ACK4WH_05185 [Phycisphaerales bacterium]
MNKLFFALNETDARLAVMKGLPRVLGDDAEIMLHQSPPSVAEGEIVLAVGFDEDAEILQSRFAEIPVTALWIEQNADSYAEWDEIPV